MSTCCTPPPPPVSPSPCCAAQEKTTHKAKIDWMIAACAPLIVIPFLLFVFFENQIHAFPWLHHYAHAVHDFVGTMWWGVLIGILFLALLSQIPREFVMSILGNKRGAGAIARAMGAGVLLDLCSHGILMIGAKLYQRGASIGQVMAFLIASPWNSISLTIILIALIGLPLTLTFLVLSMAIAFISGLIFDALADRKILPMNPNTFDIPQDFRFWPQAKQNLCAVRWTPAFILGIAKGGLKDSMMVVRWLMFGVVVASLIRTFIDPASFETYFGPTILGLTLTVFFATILEVCSEGSTPIATDLVTRAGAPGNGFAFLMAGVSTDYTEIMVLRDVTKSWKIALFLPLVTLPQIVILAWLFNIGL
jgi:uncharacterized protein